MVNYYSTPGKHVKHKLYLIAEIIFKKKKCLSCCFQVFFHTLLNLKRFQKEPSAVLTLDRWSIKALKGDFAMAAVLLHPIIMSCEKHINLRVDKNMCARTSFPPHHLAALIIFM